MSDKLKNALSELKKGDFTCVVSDGEEIIKSEERGIVPLLKLYDSGKDFSAFCAADKVVGKAAAMVYVLLGIKEIYALVISDAAAEVFTKNGISFCFDEKVPRIINRTNTGFCPMEEAVLGIDEPLEALKAVRKKLASYQQTT